MRRMLNTHSYKDPCLISVGFQFCRHQASSLLLEVMAGGLSDLSFLLHFLGSREGQS